MKKYREQLWVVLFFLFVSTVSGAESWQEPEDFRGLKWGASVDEVRKVFPTINVDKPHDLGNRIKTFSGSGQRIGDALVRLDLGFLDDRFSSVNISFKSADFLVMRNAFITRYGPAHSTTEETLKNRAGAEFVNTALNWKGPTLVIQIQKYSGTVNNGNAFLNKHEFTDELVRILKQKGKDAAKDL